MVKHNVHKDLVFDIIKHYASEDRPITPTEIEKKIEQYFPKQACERKTIKNALVHLREVYGLNNEGSWINTDIKLHYDVIPRKSSPKYTNYWLEINENVFSDEELMFLIDAVRFSKHISYKYADDIIKKLIKLSDNPFSEKFVSYKNISPEYYTIKKDFFLNLEEINDAINRHKKLSFFINRYDIDKKLHKTSETPTVVSPYRVVTSDGNYHLLCKPDDSSKIRSFRVDKMSDVKALDEDYASSPEMGRIKSHPEEYITEHRYLKSGKVVDVTLSIEKSILDDVIDTFGTKVKIAPYKIGANSLTVHVKSSETDIVEWVIRNSKYAVVLEPKSIRNEVMTRALHLAFYFIHDEKEEYEKRINTAKNTGILTLIDIDLNKFESFKKIKNVRRIVFGCNWITDFSFLTAYPNLEEIYLAYNNIQDTAVISECKKMLTIGLYNSEITNLDFLKGHKKLNHIELDEYYLENVEALYSIPNLRELYVNRATAPLIDEDRLRKIYGDTLIYEVVDFGGKPGQPATIH